MIRFSSTVARRDLPLLHLEKRRMHTCTPEFAGDNCGAPGAEHLLHHREEGRDEGLFEHAVAGEDEVSRCLQLVSAVTRGWGAGWGTCRCRGTSAPPHVSGSTVMLP
jgi:hypothetical protein